MYELREYQQEAVDKAIRYFRNPLEKNGAIEVLPTGSGKSLIIAGIARELNQPILIFQLHQRTG